MKRILSLLTLCIATTLSAVAQTTYDEIAADVKRAGGVYYDYPTPERNYTPAPKGYEPFYIWHYGRHGSRYMLQDEQYDYPVHVLNEAHAAGRLTDLGEDVRERVLKVYAVAERRGGELTQRGARQHEEIATRMVENFPELLNKKGLKVDILSSPFPRCLMSMAAFCDGLMAQNPTLDITRESSDAKMKQIHYFKPEWNPSVPDDVISIIIDKNTAWRQHQQAKEDEYIDFSRLLNSLFNDEEYIHTKVENRKFWKYLADLSLNVQCLDIEDVALYDIFTTEELYNYFRSINFCNYARYGKYIYYPLMGNIGGQTLNAIVEQIDKDLTAGTPSLSLRFGHDTCIFSLGPLMGLPGFTYASTNYELINENFHSYKATPMAANLQLVFYRKRGCEDVLVRMMHNENEVTFDISGDIAPYYRWEDLKQHWADNIKKINY